jgi:hypothetical protein
MLPGGGGGGVGLGPVLVAADPGLLEAGPTVRTAPSSTFGSHQVCTAARAAAPDAAGQLAARWTADPVTADLISKVARTTDDPEMLARLISPSLGEDPAHGGEFSESEYQTALRVRLDRGVILQRSQSPRLDWEADDGTTYDAVGNFPGRYLSSQWGNFTNAILTHVAKADYVPVDLSQFSPEQIDMVEQYIMQYGSRVFLVGQRWPRLSR